ncbi:MAG: hypothetical protein IPM85_13250 [Chitinophagaceae bacterium]|nr:hypothetical protein [Chitinophagaceae bacterium]
MKTEGFSFVLAFVSAGGTMAVLSFHESRKKPCMCCDDATTDHTKNNKKKTFFFIITSLKSGL